MKDIFLLKKYKVFISFCDQIWPYVTTFTYTSILDLMKYSFAVGFKWKVH